MATPWFHPPGFLPRARKSVAKRPLGGPSPISGESAPEVRASGDDSVEPRDLTRRPHSRSGSPPSLPLASSWPPADPARRHHPDASRRPKVSPRAGRSRKDAQGMWIRTWSLPFARERFTPSGRAGESPGAMHRIRAFGAWYPWIRGYPRVSCATSMIPASSACPTSCRVDGSGDTACHSSFGSSWARSSWVRSQSRREQHGEGSGSLMSSSRLRWPSPARAGRVPRARRTRPTPGSPPRSRWRSSWRRT